jgi:hypothetical protein
MRFRAICISRIDQNRSGDSDLSGEQIATLLRLTERYCVVYRTLKTPPAMTITSKPVRH